MGGGGADVEFVGDEAFGAAGAFEFAGGGDEGLAGAGGLAVAVFEAFALVARA